MIRYQMQCCSDHLFDGWFSNSAAFDTQADAGQIQCPLCGSPKVRKALMAPNLSLSSKHRGDDAANSGPDTAGLDPAGQHDFPDEADRAGHAAAAAVKLDQPGSASLEESFAKMREISSAMRRMRQEVEKNADYVGPRFAEEARKIHYEETEPRGIYGEASKQDIEELSEEGVEFIPLPTLREDNN